MPVYLSFVVLISDAPFRSRQQQFVLLRAGKRNWIMGQLLYIVVLSVVFTAALWFFSWVFLIPRVRWSLNWGPILTTVATRNLNLEIVLMPVSYEIMMNVTPLAATAWAAFMMIGVNILLGEIVMVCNLWAKKGLGAVIATLLVLMPFLLVIMQSTPYNVKRLLWVSPVSWINRSTLLNSNQHMPGFLYAACMTVGLDVLLGAVSITTIHKCNLDTEET